MHCIGRMVNPSALSTITVSTVNADLINSGASWTSTSPSCPASLMRVEVLQSRRRYLVYQSDTAPGRPPRLGLYVQRNAFCDPADGGPACLSDLGPPQMIAEGIDDMQIAWRVPAGWAPDGGFWCDRSTNEPCSFDQPNIQASKLAASIIGAQIYVSSRGPELKRPNRPSGLLNHPTPDQWCARSCNRVTFRNVVNP